MVVELQKAIERALQRPATGEVLAAKRDAPMLVQDRFLQALDEAIGPGMARLRPRHPDAEALAARGEGALEFFAVVRKHAPQPPSRACDRSGRTTSRRNASTAAAVTSPKISRAHANDEAASQPVICHTLPTPFSLPT